MCAYMSNPLHPLNSDALVLDVRGTVYDLHSASLPTSVLVVQAAPGGECCGALDGWLCEPACVESLTT